MITPETKRQYYSLYRERNREKIQRRYKEWRIKKGFKPRVRSQFSGLKTAEKLRRIRVFVLQHYSGTIPKCACCGETEMKFLSLDHVNGGGTQHRKKITKDGSGKGGNMAYWIFRNGFPEGFQVLCHNCNMAKGFYGICPHKVALKK